MSEKTLHLVRHHEVHAYERIGWVRKPALDVRHLKGQWQMMEWIGEDEAVIPFRIGHPSHETNCAARSTA